jgi:hypothetical protein
MMMCDGFSPASWTMYSPMSDSSAPMPAASAAWFSSISSLTIDLPLTISLAACFLQMPRMISLASSGVSAQWTWMPFGSDWLRVELEQLRQLGQVVLADALAQACAGFPVPPASGNWAARLLIRKSIAPRKLWRRKGVVDDGVLARARKPSAGLKCRACGAASSFIARSPSSSARSVPSGRGRRRPASAGCRPFSTGRK